MRMKISPAMRRVLRNLRNGDTPATGIPVYTGRLAGYRTMAHYGGLTRTLQALRRRGLIENTDDGWKLTESGVQLSIIEFASDPMGLCGFSITDGLRR